MKNIVKSILFASIFSFPLVGFSGASENSEEISLSNSTTQLKAAFIETAIDDRMVIALKNPLKENLELEILNDYGKAIYSETIGPEETFLRRYDFSELVDGNYEVKVSCNSGEFSEFIYLR
jgi:hypothetical protein